MIKLRPLKTPSLEAVQHQLDNTLFKSLAAEFNQLLEMSQPTKRDVEALPIGDLVFKHTGINIKFVCEPYHGFNAYVQIPQINKNHPLLRDWVKEYYTHDDAIRLLKQLKTNKLTGYVDRKKARVSGFFSELEPVVAIYLGMFYTYNGFKMTGEELAAAILHELGHLFSFYELLANQVTTNQALRAVKETFLNSNDVTLRIDLLKKIDEATGTTIADKDVVAQTVKSETALASVLLKTTVEATRSDLGSSIYDRRGFEYLSDQFAARLGAGVHIATGLDKMNRLYGHESYNGRMTHFFSQVTSVIGFLFLSVFSLGLWPVLCLLFGDPILNDETDSYDRPGERFARVRRELVDSLKRQNISKELKAQILADIEKIKEIESKVKDRWGVGAKVYGFLFQSARVARNKIAQQQLLEELSNNSLYVSATKLSTLS